VLSARPALAGAARAGERLTVLDVGFIDPSTSDMGFSDDPAAADFQSVQTVHKQCNAGCGPGTEAPVATIVLLAWLAARALGPRQRAGRRRRAT
jgi:hypothetical protein